MLEVRFFLTEPNGGREDISMKVVKNPTPSKIYLLPKSRQKYHLSKRNNTLETILLTNK